MQLSECSVPERAREKYQHRIVCREGGGVVGGRARTRGSPPAPAPRVRSAAPPATAAPPAPPPRPASDLSEQVSRARGRGAKGRPGAGAGEPARDGAGRAGRPGDGGDAGAGGGVAGGAGGRCGRAARGAGAGAWPVQGVAVSARAALHVRWIAMRRARNGCYHVAFTQLIYNVAAGKPPLVWACMLAHTSMLRRLPTTAWVVEGGLCVRLADTLFGLGSPSSNAVDGSGPAACWVPKSEQEAQPLPLKPSSCRVQGESTRSS